MTKIRAAGRLGALILEDNARLFRWLTEQWWIWPALVAVALTDAIAAWRS